MKTFEEKLAYVTSLKLPPEGKYSPKLDFERRCEILALYRTGVSRAVLADLYGIDRRTVTHIYNSKSPHYRTVREEEERIGSERFVRRYLTDSAVQRLQNSIGIEDIDETPRKKGNRSATKYKGVHKIMTANLNKPHDVIIAWHEDTLDNQGAGWYYQDVDGVDPRGWYHNGDDSRMTSKACYDAIIENLVDL